MKDYIINVRQRLQEFNKNAAYKKLRDHYTSKTIFEIMGKSRNETAHSSFLAWLLNGEDIPSSGNDCPLMGLLDIIIRRASEQDIYKNDSRFKLINKAVLARSIVFDNIKVKTEQNVLDLAKESINLKCTKTLNGISYMINGGSNNDLKELIAPKKGKKDSLDIYITCDVKNKGKGIGDLGNITQLEFLIENKVVSLEGKRKSNTNEYERMPQTKRYYWACNKDGVKDVMQFFIFLTASPSSDLEKGKKGENNAWCKEKDHYICINYQDIYDDILEPLITSERLSDKTELIIKEYVRSLSLPVMSSDSDGENDNKLDNSTTIMATSKRERESLLAFWNDNQDLLYSAMEVVEEKDNLQSHKWTHCIFRGKFYDKRSVIQLVYNLFKKHCEEKGEFFFQEMYAKEEFNKIVPSKKEGALNIFDESGNIDKLRINTVEQLIRKMANNSSSKLFSFKCGYTGERYIQEAYNFYFKNHLLDIPSLCELVRKIFNNFSYVTNHSNVTFSIIDNTDLISNNVGLGKIDNIYNAIRNDTIPELKDITKNIEEVKYNADSDTCDLLYSFWEFNQDFVMAALWVLSDSDGISEEDKENVAKVYSGMAKRGRSRYTLSKNGTIIDKDLSMQGVVRCLIQEEVFTPGQGNKTEFAINRLLSNATGINNIVRRKSGNKELPQYFEMIKRRDGKNDSTFYYNTQGWTRNGLFGKLKDYCDGQNCDYYIEETV